MNVSYRRCETGGLQGGRSILARQNVNFPRCKTGGLPVFDSFNQSAEKMPPNSFRRIVTNSLEVLGYESQLPPV